MSEIIMMYSHRNKRTEVIREDDGTYTVVFFANGTWMHETISTNVNEAKRLAESYVNIGDSILLKE